MILKEPYQPRTIRALELLEARGWRIKVYSILHASKARDDALIEAAKGAALELLPQPAVTLDRYGVGFVNVHQGKSYDFVTVAWWAYETELCQITLTRPSSASYRLEPLTTSDSAELSSDVWDVRLLAFERDAWLETVLTREGGPDLKGYLERRLTEEV